MQKNPNPISLRTTIPARPGPTDSIMHAAADPGPAPDPRNVYLRETMPSYVVVGKYLLGLLTVEIRTNSVPEVFNNYDDAESIIADFCQQFTAYACQLLEEIEPQQGHFCPCSELPRNYSMYY